MEKNIPPIEPLKGNQKSDAGAGAFESGNYTVQKIESPGGDQKSEKEEKVFVDYYAEITYKNEHQRSEKLKDVLHRIIVFCVMIIGISLIFGIVTLVWHILTPMCWHWLSENKIHDIQKIMSSALLAIVVNDYARKYLK